MSIKFDPSCARLIFRPQTSQWLIDIGAAACALSSEKDAIELMPHVPIRIVDESKIVSDHGTVAAAEVVDAGTPDRSLRIIQNGETSIVPITDLSSRISTIDCLYGTYEDDWLDIQAMFVIHRSSSIHFDVFIPDLPSGKSKKMQIILNDRDSQEFNVERGRIVTIGPLDIDDDVCQMMVNIEQKEPTINAADLRSLGVLLVRMHLDGHQVRAHVARYPYLSQREV